MQEEEKLEFLHQIVPKKITVKEFREILERGSDSETSDSEASSSDDDAENEDSDIEEEEDEGKFWLFCLCFLFSLYNSFQFSSTLKPFNLFPKESEAASGEEKSDNERGAASSSANEEDW